VTQSRGLGRLLEEHLRAQPDVATAAGPADIKISGCPNGCGLHHVAALGFQGSIRKVGDRAVPHYLVMVGGGADEGGATFGRTVGRIPARRVPEAVDRLVALYAAGRNNGETLASFFRRADLVQVKGAIAELEALALADTVPLDFVDLGEEHEFRADVMDGECSA
jgi:sulfite reductase beta subunit-like hemoprotein